MFVGERIIQLLEEKEETKAHLYSSIDISKSSLDNIIKGKNFPSVKVLEDIADFFAVPTDYFFDRSIELMPYNPIAPIAPASSTMDDTNKEVLYLKEILKEKERTIQILMSQKDV